MRLNVVLRYIGVVLLFTATFMLLSAIVSLINHLDTGFYPLLLSFILTAVLGCFPLIFVSKDTGALSSKEGYVVVVGAWLLACVVGMLPYLLWGGEFDFVNAWFESTSGFTTTGSTILNDVEALPRGLLFWRSSTHWLGGVGVVMFVLVILPSIGHTKKMLSSVELSVMAKDNYKYRAQKIGQILLVVYVGLTVAETILLKIAGMNWFDSVNHAFSTIATGGFSTKNLSIAYFDNIWIEVIITIFMAVSGLHFGLIFATMTGKGNNIFKSEVSRYFLIVLLVSGVVIALDLWTSDIYSSFGSALRYGLFQMVAVSSTTGFATANSSVWTPLAVLVLMFGTLQCACAGSTAGGMKCDRVLLSFKSIKAQILQRMHPNAIIRVKMNGAIQDDNVVNMAVKFIQFYFLLVVLGTFIVCAYGIDLITSFGVIASSMGNVGPGFGSIGSMDNYSILPAPIRLICTVFMLLGRLEIFGFLQIFLIKWWR